MDKFGIVRIWSDVYCIEVEISYENEYVSGKFKSYCNYSTIKKIASDLTKWKPKYGDTLKYKFNSSLDDGECILTFKQFNLNGHISISIEMKNNLDKKTKGVMFADLEGAKSAYLKNSYISSGNIITDLSSVNQFGIDLHDLHDYDYAEAKTEVGNL